MGTKYSTNATSGYNATPPADDGTVSEANKLKWSTIKEKLADPVKTLADLVNTELVTHFDTGPVAITTNTTIGASHYNQFIQVSGASVTLTLTDAASLGAGFYCWIVNTGTANVTLGRATAGDTVNGTASDYTIVPGDHLFLFVIAAANGFRFLFSSPAAATAAGTDTYTATINPAIAAYATGVDYRITFTNANTSTTPTLNLNGLGAKTIVKEGSSALVSGDIPAGHAGILRYNGTNLILLNTYYTSGYQAGSWTPSLGGTATYTSQVGSYVKIGKVIYLRFYLSVNAIGTGSVNTISGLPFTSANDTNLTVFSVRISSSATAYVEANGTINANSSQVIIEGRTAASASPSVLTTFQNSTSIQGAGFYFV